MIVPRIDRCHDRQPVIFRDMGRRERRECGEADRRLAGGERNAARRRYADAQPSEAARPGRDCNPVKLAELFSRAIHDAGDQRHQRLGVAALHRLRLACNDDAALAVEHGGRAGVECGVDGEDEHGWTDGRRTTADRGQTLKANA